MNNLNSGEYLFIVLITLIKDTVLCASGQDTLQLITIGDWGEVLFQGQGMVAEQMQIWSKVNNPEFILALGDNIYPRGIFSVDDNQMNRKWREVYHIHTELAGLQWRVLHGNHDTGFGNGTEWYQVWLTDVEPLWYFPHLWWDFVVEKADFSVHFIMFDTESMRYGTNNYTTIWPWLDEKLATSTADWLIVAGHRPIYAVGDTGPVTSALWEELRPRLEAKGVDIYLCGHDHNVQHIRNLNNQPGDLEYVVNGAGGALIYPFDPEKELFLKENHGMEVAHFTMTYGFAPLTITKDSLTFDFISGSGEHLYSFTKTRTERKHKM